jgi:nitronate monooxygenase
LLPAAGWPLAGGLVPGHPDHRSGVTQQLTGRPFGGNLVLAWDQHRRLDRALGAGLRIVSLTWGDPAPYVETIHDAGEPVPVIAAGGIGEARGVAAVLALGAQAAWLGTRFLLAEEAPVHEDYRRRLIAAAETDAHWYADLYDVGWPDAPHRAIRNSTARAWEGGELASRL